MQPVVSPAAGLGCHHPAIVLRTHSTTSKHSNTISKCPFWRLSKRSIFRYSTVVRARALCPLCSTSDAIQARFLRRNAKRRYPRVRIGRNTRHGAGNGQNEAIWECVSERRLGFQGTAQRIDGLTQRRKKSRTSKIPVRAKNLTLVNM